jgi:nitroreductase
MAMTPEELLTTTRSVRRRLDLAPPVPRDLILECIAIATQAPTGSDRQTWQWVVVTDRETRQFVGERYRESWYAYNAAGRPQYARLNLGGRRCPCLRRVRAVWGSAYTTVHLEYEHEVG